MKENENNATLETQKYIEAAACLWDVFSSKEPLSNSADQRLATLDNVQQYFSDWKLEVERTYGTKAEQASHIISWETQFDLKLSVDALKQIVNILNDPMFVLRYGQLYILPSKLNQDVVEGFFSCQRQMCSGNRNMTSYVYGYNVNGVLSSRTSSLASSKKTNLLDLKESMKSIPGNDVNKLPKRQYNHQPLVGVTWYVDI